MKYALIVDHEISYTIHKKNIFYIAVNAKSLPIIYQKIGMVIGEKLVVDDYLLEMM
jgi:hypothetical protein